MTHAHLAPLPPHQQREASNLFVHISTNFLLENIGKVLLSFLTAQIILINQKNTPDVAESGEAFTDLNYKCNKALYQISRSLKAPLIKVGRDSRRIQNLEHLSSPLTPWLCLIKMTQNVWSLKPFPFRIQPCTCQTAGTHCSEKTVQVTWEHSKKWGEEGESRVKEEKKSMLRREEKETGQRR